MSLEKRIWFAGNPWPEGHPLKAFEWTAEIREGIVWMMLHLESPDYYSEREIEDNEVNHDSDWEAPIAWGNYHSYRMSSTFWHRGGFPVCPTELFSPDFLDGHEVVVDRYRNQPMQNSTTSHSTFTFLATMRLEGILSVSSDAAILTTSISSGTGKSPWLIRATMNTNMTFER